MFRNKDNYKITKIKSPKKFFKVFIQWRKRDPQVWTAHSKNKWEKIACSENSTHDPLTATRVCVTKVNSVLCIFLTAWQSWRGRYQSYCPHNENTADKTSTLGTKTDTNRNFSNYLYIRENICRELFVFGHSKIFIVGKSFNIKCLSKIFRDCFSEEVFERVCIKLRWEYWHFAKVYIRNFSIFTKVLHLKVQSCKLYNNKYMITLTQIKNTETFTFIAVLVFKLLSPKFLFIKRKDNRSC